MASGIVVPSEKLADSDMRICEQEEIGSVWDVQGTVGKATGNEIVTKVTSLKVNDEFCVTELSLYLIQVTLTDKEMGIKKEWK